MLTRAQELRASAFAGNPETLAQFGRPEAHQTGLSRAVLILESPLVLGKSQVRQTYVMGTP